MTQDDSLVQQLERIATNPRLVSAEAAAVITAGYIALQRAEARAEAAEALLKKLRPCPDEEYVTLDYLEHTSVYDWPEWIAGDTPIVPIQNLRAAEAERDRLAGLLGMAEDALRFYEQSCDATDTTCCGYQGNLCCQTARDALAKMENTNDHTD